MGASPADSVVDPLFTVFGVDNLSIVDASVIPSLPSGNPQAAIFAMAHIAAKTIGDNVRTFA
jgi:choline dehydrogenase-like flavoprotein